MHLVDEHDAVRVRSIEDLLTYFESAGKPASQWRMGTEHELVIVPDAPHTFHLQPKQRDLRPLVLGFFDKHLKPAPKSSL